MANEEHALEYICIHCWKGFRGHEAGQSADGSAVLCPHCGTAQPTVDELLAPIAEPESRPATGVAHLAAVHSAHEDDPMPQNVVPLPRPAPSAQPGDPNQEDNAEEAYRETVLAMDPNAAPWRLRSPIGITFNFPGWDALLRWAQGRSGAQQLAVAVLDLELWKDFDDLLEQLRETPDPRLAFLLARPSGQRPGSDPNRLAVSPQSPLGTELAKFKGTAAPAPSPGGRTSDARGTRSRGAAGSAERTAEKEPPRTPPAPIRLPASTQITGTAALFFGLGFLTGAATLFVLWYVRVLDMLPFGR